MSRHVNSTTPRSSGETEEPIDVIIGIGTDLINQGQEFVQTLFRPWNQYQILIAIGIFAIAHILRAVFGPRIRAWMAARENWPKWRMRILVTINQRLRAIFFIALLWATILAMREITWPSRSYLLGIIGTLAFAWLSIIFITRLINSPSLRKLAIEAARHGRCRQLKIKRALPRVRSLGFPDPIIDEPPVGILAAGVFFDHTRCLRAKRRSFAQPVYFLAGEAR